MSTYLFNETNKMTQVTTSDGTWIYEYDPLGNVTQVDDEHSKLALGVYRDACKPAHALAAKGKHAEAASSLRAVSARFRDTPWHCDAGEARITSPWEVTVRRTRS